jgi:hypothetical protein
MTTQFEPPSDRARRVLAVLMGLMAVSNFWKPMAQMFAPESSAGFVFLGHRLQGVANAIMGPLFGVLLAAYAYGAWTGRRWVVPLAIAYAAYVPVNLVLFSRDPPPGPEPPFIFLLLYAIVAIGVSSGGALHLYRNRDRLS